MSREIDIMSPTSKISEQFELNKVSSSASSEKKTEFTLGGR